MPSRHLVDVLRKQAALPHFLYALKRTPKRRAWHGAWASSVAWMAYCTAHWTCDDGVIAVAVKTLVNSNTCSDGSTPTTKTSERLAARDAGTSVVRCADFRHFHGDLLVGVS